MISLRIAQLNSLSIRSTKAGKEVVLTFSTPYIAVAGIVGELIGTPTELHIGAMQQDFFGAIGEPSPNGHHVFGADPEPQPVPEPRREFEVCSACDGNGKFGDADEGNATSCENCQGAGRIEVPAPAEVDEDEAPAVAYLDEDGNEISREEFEAANPIDAAASASSMPTLAASQWTASDEEERRARVADEEEAAEPELVGGVNASTRRRR